ncbi:serine hydrolase domain-containing protein [Luteibacter yeojuensis]|uniref:Beta-lactamase family protein n=1 Tax=Luteibacter yeojuensis TaxID=345309 RepID=A0A7X5QSQ1_9GAMM|nr:serine hydrolase domain-containing protein [Luteibacter yeojuensis]NID14639.1 beta-lactamase family protein [Luteibacter yeojuensis]
MKKGFLLTIATAWTAVVSASGVPDWKPKADVIVESVPADGPGACVAVVKGGQLIYSTSRGLSSIELNVALSAASRFRVGSLTKTVTAAAIMKLQAEGRLKLDDPVAKWLPGFPSAAGITVRELLNHTSGISDAWEAPLAEPLDTTHRLALIGKAGSDFPPGTDWRYSNSGYMVLGAILEKITGLGWSDAERELVLDPLGIDAIGYHDDATIVPGMASGYSTTAADVAVKPQLYSITGPGAAGALDGDAGSVAMLLHRLASGPEPWPAIFRSMATSARLGSQQLPYGLGTAPGDLHGVAIVEHSGGIDGYSAYYVYAPGQDVAVAVLENSDAPKVSARSLARRIAALALDVPYRTFEPATWSRETINALEGAYVIDGDSRHLIAVRNGVPWIRRDGGPEKRLVPSAGHVLIYINDGTDFIEPVLNERGAVTALKFHADGQASSRLETRVP